MSAAKLARRLNVPANRITGVLNGPRSPERRPRAWLVTSQKDAVNLCEAARELVAPLPRARAHPRVRPCRALNLASFAPCPRRAHRRIPHDDQQVRPFAFRESLDDVRHGLVDLMPVRLSQAHDQDAVMRR